jgi:hypothetical protein
MAGQVINDELEWIYKKVAMTCTDTCLGGIRKIMKTLSQNSWCLRLPNTTSKNSHKTNLLKKFTVELKLKIPSIPLP